MSIYWTLFGPNVFIHPLWITSLFWGLLIAAVLAAVALRRGWARDRARGSLVTFLTAYLILIAVLVASYVLPCVLELARCLLGDESDPITYQHIRNETLQRTLTGILAGAGFGLGPAGVRWLAKRGTNGRAEERGAQTEPALV